MLKGLSLKTTAFVVLILFILPMVSFLVPQIGTVETANAATALINKATSATYRSNSGSFSASGYYATAFPADSSVTRPQQAFDDDATTRFYNGSASTLGPYGVMFAFNDTCSKIVNKIFIDIGPDSGTDNYCAGKITLIATNSASSFTRTSFSGTTIPGHLYRARDGVEMDDNTADKGITAATAVSNSVPTTYPASINITSVSAREKYYFIPDAPVNAKYIALLQYQTAAGQTTEGKISLYEMKFYDVKGENLDLSVDPTLNVPVVLNHTTTQTINLPVVVKDAVGHAVIGSIKNAITVTATNVDGGALPSGVSLDTSVPGSPKLMVAPEATAGAVRITWAYADSEVTYPTSVTSAVSLSKDISLEEQVSATGVSLNKETTNIVRGQTETLTATVAPSDANIKSVLWTSSKTTVATVADGVVSAKAYGTTTITATTVDGGFIATCEVTVIGAVTGISLNKKTASLVIGNTETLIPTFSPLEAINKNILWMSSNNSVATVDDFGVVTAVAVGTADILVTTYDGGYTDTCTVTVTEFGTVKYNVTGTVSALTGADLTKVTIVAKQADVTIETVSALADGTFSISLEPGVYTFTISRTGYLTNSFTDFTVTTDASQVLSTTTINLTSGDVVVTDQNTIDLQDLQRILSNFGLTSVDASFNAMYDLNDDGAINLIDLQAVLKNFGAVQ